MTKSRNANFKSYAPKMRGCATREKYYATKNLLEW